MSRRCDSEIALQLLGVLRGGFDMLSWVRQPSACRDGAEAGT